MARAPVRGFPQHGDEFKAAEDDEDNDEEAAGGENDDEDNQDEPKKPEKGSIEERLARLEGENAALRATLATRPVEKAREPDPEPEVDYEKLMYDDPKAFVKQLKKEVRSDVEKELGGKYAKDQGEREFWNEFYADHDDLKDDKDLVQTTLRTNIATLGDLPVREAQKRLADLTRERIMRYTGKREKKDDASKTRARVEGSGASQKPSTKAAEDDGKVVTLSDIIRARKAKRMKAMSA